MAMMRITGGLLVSDYEEALQFYVNRLGFEVIEDIAMGPDRWVTISLPGASGFVFALHEAQTPADAALLGKQAGSFPLFGIHTDDCVGEYWRMKSLGVTFHGEPERQPYGTGVMLEDLYGNLIYLNEEARQDAP
jgi:catechol 2,3-dioxygenase-like lactoylglutathione lyase family enzyme